MSLPKELTTVTPLSKTIALIMFISMPIIAFFLGMQYQEMLSNQQILLMQENIMRSQKIPTPTPDASKWKTYTDKLLNFSFQYPYTWDLQSQDPFYEAAQNGKKFPIYSISVRNKARGASVSFRVNPETDWCNPGNCTVVDYTTASGLKTKKYSYTTEAYYPFRIANNNVIVFSIYGQDKRTVDEIVHSLSWN